MRRLLSEGRAAAVVSDEAEPALWWVTLGRQGAALVLFRITLGIAAVIERLFDLTQGLGCDTAFTVKSGSPDQRISVRADPGAMLRGDYGNRTV